MNGPRPFPPQRSQVQWLGLLLGPVAALLVYLVLPDSYSTPEGVKELGQAGRATAAVACWMATWWLTEAIDLAVTALLPVALFPLLGIAGVRQATAPYAHYLIFLFLGGFMLSLAMQRWGLHRRVALRILLFTGTSPARLVGGFMLATALLSMWVSNTATTIMMLPIALSVLGRMEEGQVDPRARRRLALCLLLGVAYAASIGGIGTLVGTPPNLFMASFVQEEFGREIGFLQWLGVGLPLVALFLPLTWLLLTRIIYPLQEVTLPDDGPQMLRQYRALGGMSVAERRLLLVFLVTVLAWVSRPLLNRLDLFGVWPLAGLSDAGIAILAGLALFLTPADRRRRGFLLEWKDLDEMPWGILILFGGGLSLAHAISVNGVGDYLGHQVTGLAGMPPLVLVLAVATLVIFLTELTSNTATTATLLPILAAAAPVVGVDPYALVVTAAVAASCAFMMPVATPPNAIVFASGEVTVPQMCRAGLWLNFIGIALITALVWLIALPLLGTTG